MINPRGSETDLSFSGHGWVEEERLPRNLHCNPERACCLFQVPLPPSTRVIPVWQMRSRSKTKSRECSQGSQWPDGLCVVECQRCVGAVALLSSAAENGKSSIHSTCSKNRQRYPSCRIPFAKAQTHAIGTSLHPVHCRHLWSLGCRIAPQLHIGFFCYPKDLCASCVASLPPADDQCKTKHPVLRLPLDASSRYDP